MLKLPPWSSFKMRAIHLMFSGASSWGDKQRSHREQSLRRDPPHNVSRRIQTTQRGGGEVTVPSICCSRCYSALHQWSALLMCHISFSNAAGCVGRSPGWYKGIHRRWIHLSRISLEHMCVKVEGVCDRLDALCWVMQLFVTVTPWTQLLRPSI